MSAADHEVAGERNSFEIRDGLVGKWKLRARDIWNGSLADVLEVEAYREAGHRGPYISLMTTNHADDIANCLQPDAARELAAVLIAAADAAEAE